ncbi:AraC family transcriptional regulator [Colwellia sp. 1_MG-2023]|uniref:AraC family transcriptional regulator n=1 Tax=Colwellia sp. 1_MG-2023 TaxID=3062649 RepID=UPI0026E37E2A|nr:AraC family transcriptional regulator [Colwellia sp. 1_MG-2023]MDO6447191.1 AraC family transcriptional regulator [Colwellia sp. 1_MG-2023]
MTEQNVSRFIAQMGGEQLISMFDLLPGVLFWIKDKNHNFIHANQAFIDHKSVKGLQKIVGKTDFDFSPPHLAKQFIRDDNKILAGQSVTERLEMNMTETGDAAWYATSKRPITNKQGEIIGSYGITRHLQKQTIALSGVDAVKVPVDYIRSHYHQHFTIDELAEVAHLSVSALERRFKKYLAKTPKQFINEVRLENARRLLVESNTPISQVGEETGFTDHSYFSKQFRLFFGVLPSDFRQSSRK